MSFLSIQNAKLTGALEAMTKRATEAEASLVRWMDRATRVEAALARERQRAEAAEKERDKWATLLRDIGRTDSSEEDLQLALTERNTLIKRAEAAERELVEHSDECHVEGCLNGRLEDEAFTCSRCYAAEKQRAEAAERQLTEAAREINCAGPIAHRIRILKSEHQAQFDRLEAQLAAKTAECEQLRTTAMLLFTAEEFREGAVEHSCDGCAEKGEYQLYYCAACFAVTR